MDTKEIIIEIKESDYISVVDSCANGCGSCGSCGGGCGAGCSGNCN